MGDRPTADQAARDPNFQKGDVTITGHGPAHSDGVDRDAARPPTVTGKDS
jgi:hypothetical protein